MMNEKQKLAVEYTQFLLRSVAIDLDATKELLGEGSPLTGNAGACAASILRSIADGFNKPIYVAGVVETKIALDVVVPK